jgi:hypothetical protein
VYGHGIAINEWLKSSAKVLHIFTPVLEVECCHQSGGYEKKKEHTTCAVKLTGSGNLVGDSQLSLTREVFFIMYPASAVLLAVILV